LFLDGSALFAYPEPDLSFERFRGSVIIFQKYLAQSNYADSEFSLASITFIVVSFGGNTLTTATSITYFSRVAAVLANENRMGITNLAMAARMNHKRCLSIVLLMERCGYVRLVSDGRKKEVIVTERGLDYFKQFVSLVLPITSIIVTR
jgi:predicted transcriptional regulator